jgi:hypothetical protein
MQKVVDPIELELMEMDSQLLPKEVIFLMEEEKNNIASFKKRIER